MMTHFYRHYVYAGGGVKLEKPEEQGYIFILADGSLEVGTEDDYYGGTVSAADARALALAILERIDDAKTR